MIISTRQQNQFGFVVIRTADEIPVYSKVLRVLTKHLLEYSSIFFTEFHLHITAGTLS